MMKLQLCVFAQYYCLAVPHERELALTSFSGTSLIICVVVEYVRSICSGKVTYQTDHNWRLSPVWVFIADRDLRFGYKS